MSSASFISINLLPMLDPRLAIQTHFSMEILTSVQTHTLLEKTAGTHDAMRCYQMAGVFSMPVPAEHRYLPIWGALQWYPLAAWPMGTTQGPARRGNARHRRGVKALNRSPLRRAFRETLTGPRTARRRWHSWSCRGRKAKWRFLGVGRTVGAVTTTGGLRAAPDPHGAPGMTPVYLKLRAFRRRKRPEPPHRSS